MGGFSNLGSVYVEVGADLSALAKELQGAVSEAAAAGQEIGQALERGITASAPAAATGLHEVASGAHDAQEGFSELAGSLSEVAELFGVGLGIAEGVESLKSLAEESIDAYGKIQLATVALTALTGSAQAAEETLSSMKQLALGSIFDFPSLATAAQQLANIGVSAETIPPAMKAIVDAAEGSGHSLDAVSSAFDRIVNTGNVSARTLNQLGINLDQLGETAGMSGEDVKKAFAAMGPGSADSLNILIATIERLKASAGDNVVGTLPQQINAVKVQWDSLLESLGGAVAGPFGTLLANVNQLIATFTAFGEAVKSISGSGGVLTNLFPQIQVVGQAWGWFKDQILLATAAIDTATGKYPSFGAAIESLTKQVQGVTDATKANKDAEDMVNAALAGSKQAAAEALAADENRKALKTELTQATTLAAAAEKSLAEDMRALSIPTVKDLGQAEADVAVTRAALVVADGLEQTALAGLNAERDKAVPNATVLKQLETDLKNASTESTLARQALKDAEAALNTTRTTAKQQTSELSQDEQALANYLKAITVPTIMDYKTALDAVNAAKKTAGDAAAALTVAEKEYNAAVKGGDPAAIAAATLALSTARATLKTDTVAVTTAEQNLNKSQAAVLAASKEIQATDKLLDDFYLKEMTPHLVDLTAAIKDGTAAKGDASDAADNLRSVENQLQSAILDEGDATQHVKDLTAEVAAARVALTDKTKDLHDIEQKIATDFAISLADVKLLIDAQTQGVTSTQLLGDAYAALGIKTQAALQAAVSAAQYAYSQIIAAGNLSVEQQTQALGKLVAAYEAAGQAVPDSLQAAYGQGIIKTQDFINDSVKLWTQFAIDIDNEMKGMFSGLITDLFTGGDFVKTMEDTLKKIGETIVSAIFKPFTDLISQTISSLITPLAITLAGWIKDALIAIFPGLAGALGGVIGGAATAANTAAVTANTAALGALTAALGTAAGASAAGGAASGAGGLGSAATSLASSAAGIVTAIGSIGSMITGAIGDILQAHTNTLLDRIEQNTRDSAFYLGGNNSMGGILLNTFLIKDAILYGNMAQYLVTIKDVLDGQIKDDIHDIGQSAHYSLLNLGAIVADLDKLVAATSPAAPVVPATGTVPPPVVVPTLPSIPGGSRSGSGRPMMDSLGNPVQPSGFGPQTVVPSLSIVGRIYLDSQELFSSFVRWSEDNGLVVPQS